MNPILYIGAHGGASFGLILIFLLIWLISYFYGTWKQREKMVISGGGEKMDRNYWNQRIFLLVVGLIGLFLPIVKSLFGRNITGSGGFEKSFEEYSSQAVLNLILFFLFPFLISSVIMVVKRQFPTRIFNNLVIIMVVLVLFISTLNTFHRG